MMSHREEQHVMYDDESLADLLTAFATQNSDTTRVFSGIALDTTIVLPHQARHAGHADVIRESIDGATMFPPSRR